MMKIQLSYDRLSQIKTDLLVVILDDERTFPVRVVCRGEEHVGIQEGPQPHAITA